MHEHHYPSPLRALAGPLAATVVLASAGTVIAATTSATAGDTLPKRTAAQLLVDVQKANLAGLSGTVVQTADLGLPSIPGAGGGDSPEFSSLVAGSHTLRVWAAGPEKSRVALLGQYGESDLVHNGTDVWAWSSTTNTAHHVTITPHAADGDHAAPDAGDPSTDLSELPSTPQAAADQALAAIEPTTRVTTDRTAVVAGRTAYQLVLTPKDPATLVGSVRIAIDSATHVPTRVQVFAKGAGDPAFEVGFTSFDPSTPSDSVFAFNPPPGAKVVEGMTGTAGGSATEKGTKPEGTQPTTVGDGWSTVVVATLPADSSSTASTKPDTSSLGALSSVIGQLPTASGTWGTGHVLKGALFSAVLTDDGRVALGAVKPEQLYAALGAQ